MYRIPLIVLVMFGMASSARGDNVAVAEKDVQAGIQALENHYKHFERYIVGFEELGYTDSGQFRTGSTEPHLKRKFRQFRDPPRWYEIGYQVVWDKRRGNWDWRGASEEGVGESLFDGSRIWGLGNNSEALILHAVVTEPVYLLGQQYGFMPFTSGWLEYSGDLRLVTILRESAVTARGRRQPTGTRRRQQVGQIHRVAGHRARLRPYPGGGG